MALFQQLLRLRHQRAFWLTISLFAIVIVSNLLNLFQTSNAFSYQSLESFNQTQQTNIVLVTSDNLSRDHQQLVTKLHGYKPNAIIVLADKSLAALPLANVYYPYSNSGYCGPKVETWASYHVQIPAQSDLACSSIWQEIFGYQSDKARLIDFNLAVEALPKFSAQRVLDIDVMSEQLENKIIIVGQKASQFNIQIHAPKVNGLNDPLLITAYMADSIDKNTTVERLNPAFAILIELILVTVLLFSFQKLSLAFSFFIAFISTIIWCCIGYGLIEYVQLFIPIGQYIILTFITLLWVIIVRKVSEDADLNVVVNNIQQKMIGRFVPQSFINQASPWDPIIQLISQQLDLEKSIFLARMENDHRVIEIRAVNCNLDDIQEMRRDYQRAPYSNALKSLGVVQIERPFFEHVSETEIEFMVPLVYAGDVRGFWALSVVPNEHFNQQAFEKNVNRFAAQVAELLFHYHIFKVTEKKDNTLLNQLLTLRLHEPTSQQVKRSITEMEQKMTTLEMVFNHTRSANIFFNLFGQVIQTNAALEQFAKQHQIAIFEMTALDLLCRCCALDEEVAKGKLRYVTLNKAEINLPAKLNDQSYTLNIKALHTDNSKTVSGEPFQVSGILFEFVNICSVVSNQDNHPEGHD